MNGFSKFGGTPPVVKNLIYINVVMLVATWALGYSFGYDLNEKLGLFFFKSSNFQPYQYITYMFMHGGIAHIFFNMFALWMFGRVLENVWGSKRFLFYYLVTGIGAAVVQTLVNYIEFQYLASKLDPEQLNIIMDQGLDLMRQGKNYADPTIGGLNSILNAPTVGASGAVFGILLAFGMLFPNTELMLLFPPIPIKAKWLVIIYGGLELYMGISQTNSNIAHFAHLGGMAFGFFLIKYWNKKRTTFY
jgi:membrane associated rhomboid family serine protease